MINQPIGGKKPVWFTFEAYRIVKTPPKNKNHPANAKNIHQLAGRGSDTTMDVMLLTKRNIKNTIDLNNVVGWDMGRYSCYDWGDTTSTPIKLASKRALVSKLQVYLGNGMPPVILFEGNYTLDVEVEQINTFFAAMKDAKVM